MKKYLLTLFLFTSLGSLFAQFNTDGNGCLSSNPSIVSVATIPSRATTATIMHQIPSPTSGVDDIAFDGENLWVGGFGDFVLFKVAPSNGQILKTIPTNILRPYGLEFVNGELWVVANDLHMIQEVDTSNGNVISSIPTPSTYATSYPGGLAWDGQYFWNNDPNSSGGNPYDSLYNFTATGMLLQSHHTVGTYASGLAWDGQYLWSADNPTAQIYAINTNTFVVMDTIQAPGGAYPNGLAFDGQYLWIANNDHDSLYQVDIGHVTGIKNVNPDHQFSVYPNPATDNIFITTSDDHSTSYSILDEYGRCVLSGKLNPKKTSVDLHALSPGIYLVSCGDKNRQQIKIIRN
jgi:hypothetical protein